MQGDRLRFVDFLAEMVGKYALSVGDENMVLDISGELPVRNADADEKECECGNGGVVL